MFLFEFNCMGVKKKPRKISSLANYYGDSSIMLEDQSKNKLNINLRELIAIFQFFNFLVILPFVN